MFKKILVPVDGSSAANAGLRAALALAREQKARIRLVHLAQIVVAPPAAGGFPVSELYAQLREAGERCLERAEAACKAARIACEKRLHVALLDHASDVILAEAAKWPADVIVMGTHGRRGVRRLALGSDAERVVRASRSPVLVVPGRQRA